MLHREKVTAKDLSALGCMTLKVQVMINISTDGTDNSGAEHKAAEWSKATQRLPWHCCCVYDNW